jgi:transcriptional regulator with XRE-family HTH domain
MIMDIHKLRTDRGWSQEQVAEMAGLSSRTVQRVENGDKPSAETAKALAAVFEIPLIELQSTNSESPRGKPVLSRSELQVISEIRQLKAFYIHLFWFVVIIPMLFLINVITSTHYIWAVWPFLAWGLGVLTHGATIYRPFRRFGSNWEREEFEKRLRDKQP